MTDKTMITFLQAAVHGDRLLVAPLGTALNLTDPGWVDAGLAPGRIAGVAVPVPAIPAELPDTRDDLEAWYPSQLSEVLLHLVTMCPECQGTGMPSYLLCPGHAAHARG
jgi:hypothetical protein